MRLHHVQVSCPRGGEDVARRFWVEGLGLVEVEKPVALRARGGAWFRAYAAADPAGPAGAEVHVGVEEPFVPAGKAHPALLLGSVAELDVTTARLETLGFEVDLGERFTFDGHERAHVRDGHGNRVELLAVGEHPR